MPWGDFLWVIKQNEKDVKVLDLCLICLIQQYVYVAKFRNI